MRTAAVLALLLSVGAARADCPALEREVGASVSDLGNAMDQAGALRGVGEAALRALRTCPDSARLWYLAARAAEVLDLAFGARAFAPDDAAGLVAKAVAHAPNSAEIAVVAARRSGAASDARRAYELNPAYRPGRRLYALSLAGAGEAAKALDLVAGTERGDGLARARVLLAARRFAEAARAARAAEAAPPVAEDEPGLEASFHRDALESLGLALLGEGRRREALAPLRVAAGLGSAKAAAALKP